MTYLVNHTLFPPSALATGEINFRHFSGVSPAFADLSALEVLTERFHTNWKGTKQAEPFGSD
jgi:hypothetical protein